MDQSISFFDCIRLLLMFMAKDDAVRMIGELQAQVSEGGLAIINGLIEGTTYLDILGRTPTTCSALQNCRIGSPAGKCLNQDKAALGVPAGTTKAFATLITPKLA